LFKAKSDCLNRSESQFKGLKRTLKFFFPKNNLSYRQVAPGYNLRYSTVNKSYFFDFKLKSVLQEINGHYNYLKYGTDKQDYTHTRFLTLFLKLHESLMESFPQLILQLSIFLHNFKYDQFVMTSNNRFELTSLEIKQIISILSSIFTVSFGSMSYVKFLAKHEIKINLGNWLLFSITRLFTNALHLISCVLPMALLIGEFESNYLLLIFFVCFYILLKNVAFYFYFLKIFLFRKTVNEELNVRMFASAFFNFLKWASFVEEFEFNFPIVLYHYFTFAENFTLFSIYYFYSTRSQQIQLLFGSISFVTFWLGIFIEIYYWKFCFCCTKKRDEKKMSLSQFYP